MNIASKSVSISTLSLVILLLLTTCTKPVNQSASQTEVKKRVKDIMPAPQPLKLEDKPVVKKIKLTKKAPVENLPIVSIQKVKFITEKPVEQSLAFTGIVTATKQQDTYSNVAGVVSEVLFKKGDYVKKGAPLYKIDKTGLTTAVTKSKSALTTAKAKLQSAKKSHEQYKEALNINNVILKQDKEDLKRYQQLIDVGAISEQAYDQALSKVETTQSAIKHNKVSIQKALADIQTAKANIQQVKNNVTEQTEALKQTVINASSSGIITESTVNKGTQILSQADAYVRISTLDPILIDMTMSADDFLLLKDLENKKSLPKVQLITADGKTHPQTGKIIFSNDTIGKVHISVANKKNKLLPNMIVKTIIKLPNNTTDTKVVVLPLDAVQYFPIYSASNNKPTTHHNQMQHYVYLFDKKTSKIQRQFVKLDGLIDNNQLRVTSGLQQGDNVVVNTNAILRDKQKVSVNNMNTTVRKPIVSIAKQNEKKPTQPAQKSEKILKNDQPKNIQQTTKSDE